MEKIVKLENGRAVVTSKELAEKFGKTHRHVLRDIKALECSNEFRESNFGLSSYTSSQNKVLPCVNITRDGFCFLAMGFTGKESAKWKEAYIKAFNEMEGMLISVQEHSVMQKLSDAIEIMEKDKSIASGFGSGLNEWKKIRAGHIDKVNKLMSDAQLLLKF